MSDHLNETIVAVKTTHDEEGIELYTLSSQTMDIGHITHDARQTIVFLSEQYLLDKKMHRWGLGATIKGSMMNVDIPSKRCYDILLDANNIALSAAYNISHAYMQNSSSKTDLTGDAKITAS